MHSPWNAEYIVTPSLASKLIVTQFPQLSVRSIELTGVGWDNTAYLINSEYIFRFPRRAVAVHLLEIEYAMLPRIGSKLPLAIPTPKWFGSPTDEYPWPFLGYPFIEGITADRLDLTLEERIELIEPIVHFLKSLHAIPSAQFESIVPGDVLGKLDVTMRLPKILEAIQKLEMLHIFGRAKELYALVYSMRSLRADHDRVIVHGDFYIRHILLNGCKQLTGVIDWGDIALASPALDLSIMYSFFPPRAHQHFKELYGVVSPEIWDLALFRAINHSVLLTLYGYDVGDKDLLREGLRSLGYITMQ